MRHRADDLVHIKTIVTKVRYPLFQQQYKFIGIAVMQSFRRKMAMRRMIDPKPISIVYMIKQGGAPNIVDQSWSELQLPHTEH
jgi:hypothetical protein